MPIGIDPIATYAFHVNVDGVTIAQFKEVDGLSISVGVIEHRSNTNGGQPVMRKLPGTVKFENIVLSRGKVNDAAFWTWIKQVQDGDIDGARRDGSVILYDYAHGQVSKFDFKQGWPCKVELGKLQSATDTVLLETVTITHERLEIG
jgi:phage tail-like protein